MYRPERRAAWQTLLLVSKAFEEQVVKMGCGVERDIKAGLIIVVMSLVRIENEEKFPKNQEFLI